MTKPRTRSQLLRNSYSATSLPSKLALSHLAAPSQKSQTLTTSKRARKPWRKLLWVHQEYPDNWVDASFLDKLQRNANVVAYDFWPLVGDSTVLTSHLASVIVFVCAFVGIYDDAASPLTVVGVSTALTVLGYLYWTWQTVQSARPTQESTVRTTEHTRPETIKSAVLIVLTILGLSPILNSLTLSSDSDSIWTIALYLFLANIAFLDYSLPKSTYSMGNAATHNLSYSGTLSTNAAIMASVVLASRLRESFSVFALILFAVEWFALFPIFRRFLRLTSFRASLALTVVLVLGACVTLAWCVSTRLAALWISMVIFITFGCPLWLISLQKYKNEIHGPWDIAKPVLKDAIL
ncbi:pig-C [Protomyces lactucae-debilis]|uniref:Pig-C n=1 Tax=Protomyces lactucae-debilis TaxID=2754530 RepID=A0A1Y2F7L1_PROLT|nr:pig-C [Protomyces lactucae-debilis]ORY79849.1 pig-C [Protomyces lactucae-debilis]